MPVPPFRAGGWASRPSPLGEATPHVLCSRPMSTSMCKWKRSASPAPPPSPVSSAANGDGLSAPAKQDPLPWGKGNVAQRVGEGWLAEGGHCPYVG